MSPTAVAESAVDSQELYFENGLPGFPDARRFTLARWGDEESPFSIMRSVEEDGLEFVVVPPIVFFPDYAPEVDDSTVGRLDLHTAEDALVLAVVTLGEKPSDANSSRMSQSLTCACRHSTESQSRLRSTVTISRRGC